MALSQQVRVERRVQVLAGVLILAAAAFKLFSFTSSQGDRTHFQSLLSLAVIEVEFILAMLILFNAWPETTSYLTLLFFSASVLFNIRSVWLGESTCSCFGNMPVSPWVTLGVGVLFFTTLMA